jgi:hypothetical protein
MLVLLLKVRVMVIETFLLSAAWINLFLKTLYK